MSMKYRHGVEETLVWLIGGILLWFITREFVFGLFCFIMAIYIWIKNVRYDRMIERNFQKKSGAQQHNEEVD